MNKPAPLYRAVRLGNALLFSLALALVFDQSLASALGRLEATESHWSSGQRDLVVVDNTGDRAWQEATRHAVAMWSQVEGAPRLSWEAGRGPCRADGARIGFCKAPRRDLGDEGNLEREGLARVQVGDSHTAGAVVMVCRECRFRPDRRRVVAAHELGHVLGLGHSTRPGSLMFPTGGPDRPDGADLLALQALYAHRDEPVRCAVFNLRLGALCF